MSAEPGSEPKDLDALSAAADWFAILQSDNVTEEEKQGWRAWVKASPENGAAWRNIQSVQEQCDQVRELDDNRQALTKALKTEGASRKFARSVGGLTAILLLAFALSYLPLQKMYQVAIADFQTGTGERLTLTLEDGTQLWLNAITAVNVDYTADRRLITLLEGEVLVDTGKDDRPLAVRVAQGDLHPMGTRFAVRTLKDRTRVAVYEGVVEIRMAGLTKEIVPAGRQSSFNKKVVAPLKPAKQTDIAWVKNRLVADNMPLGVFVEELQRFHSSHLHLDPAVANLSVMGTFPTDNPNHVLTMLSQILPVKVEKTLPLWISIKPHDSQSLIKD